MRLIRLIALVAAAGLLAVLLMDEATEPTDPSMDDQRAAPAKARTAAESEPPGEPEPDLPDTGPEDVVPRILPPDAALEDIRDALARGGEEGARELRVAYEATGRIAAEKTSVMHALHRQIESLEDPRARGVATAALGGARSEANRRWLEGMLSSGRTPEDRLGGLIALAWPAEDAKAGRRASAVAASLGGLRYEYTALGDETTLADAMVAFLAAHPGASAQDAVPIIHASAKQSALHATLLAADGKEASRWFLALRETDRASLRAVALAHESLLPEVRATLERAK